MSAPQFPGQQTVNPYAQQAQPNFQSFVPFNDSFNKSSRNFNHRRSLSPRPHHGQGRSDYTGLNDKRSYNSHGKHYVVQVMY